MAVRLEKLDLLPQGQPFLDNSLAFLTPGQGGQAIKLGFPLAERSKSAAAIKEMAGDYFGGEFLDVWQNGPLDKVNKTHWAQYIVATDTLMRMAVLEDEQPNGTENLFLRNGESREKWRDGLSAGLITAGVGVWYRPEDAFKLIKERGRIMGDFFEGLDAKMFALMDVGEEDKAEMLKRFDVRLCLDNTDTQQVYGGPTQEVRAAVHWLAGERNQSDENVMELPIGGVFHHVILEPVVKAIEPEVRSMNMFSEAANGKVLMSNVTGRPLETEVEVRRELLQHNLVPVQHKKTIYYLVGQGVRTMVVVDSSRRLAVMTEDMFEGDSRKKITMNKKSPDDKPPILFQTWRADELEVI